MVSHTAGADWQSFELRMRRRRAERLVLRADVAADEGCPDAARSCLEEARTLAPGLPELALIEAKLLRTSRPHVSTAFRWSTIAAACVVALLMGVAATRLGSVPAAIDAPALSQVARTPELPAVERAAATVAPAVRPMAVPAKPEPARDTRGVEPLPAVRAVAPAVPSQRAAAPAFTAVTELPAASVPVTLAMVPVTVPESIPPAPPAAPAPVEPPQEVVVRSVLSRYASAYSALDAAAAQRVWPGVNRAALSRAFEGLASQQISLGDCRIDVAASNARARCAGSATWSPKVGGGGARTEARDWTFELARAASGWQIVSARVQNR
jgi:hypothetical protein